MSTKHLILGLAAAALVGSVIGAGHVFAGDDALQVNAAEVGEKLPSIKFPESPYNGIPFVVTTDEEASTGQGASLGDIKVDYLINSINSHASEGADLAYRITLFDAGTEPTLGKQPAFSEDKVITTFDFDNTHSFILGYGVDNNGDIVDALVNAYLANPTKVNPLHYIGFRGQLVDRGGVYEDGDPITFYNSFCYSNLFKTPTFSSNCYFETSGDLHNQYFSDVTDWMEPFLQLEVGFFDVGANPVEGIPEFDPSSNKIVATVSMTNAGWVTKSMIEDAFLRAGVIESNNYYGAVGRFAPRDGVADNPFTASEWVPLSGSHQYYVDAPKQELPGLLIRNKTIYTTQSENAVALNDGVYEGGTWFADSTKSPAYILIDLGNAYDLTQFGIEWEGAYATDYDIYFGNPVVNQEDPFADGFLNGWKNSQVLSYDADSELKPATTEQLFTYYPLDTLDETVSARYILISLNVALNDAWGYRIFEIAAEGTPSEHSYAYYATKEYLTGLDCMYFQGDSNKAKEVNATLTYLYNQLSSDEHLALASEMINGVTTYEDRAIYLIERSAFYAAQTSSGAKLIGGDSSSFAPIIATVALLGAAGGAALLLAKSRKRSK